jgi:hypothetical protein
MLHELNKNKNSNLIVSDEDDDEEDKHNLLSVENQGKLERLLQLVGTLGRREGGGFPGGHSWSRMTERRGTWMQAREKCYLHEAPGEKSHRLNSAHCCIVVFMHCALLFSVL